MPTETKSATNLSTAKTAPGKPSRAKPSGAGFQRFALLAVWAAVALSFVILKPDTFATTANVQIIFGSQAVLLIIALAVILPLTAGEFDLSVASVLSLAAMLVAFLNVNAGWPIWAALLAAMVMGLLVGLFNGALVVGLGLDSFIVTLGSGTVLLGVVAWVSGSQTISGIDASLVDWTINHRILGVSMSFWYGLILCAVLWYVFRFTPAGRRLLFVGRGRGVARLSGLRVDRIRILSMTVASFLAAFAGVIYAGSIGGADPSSGQSYLLPAFAAAFLGSTAINPGRFNPWGTFIAVYFLVTGITGLQLIGAQDFIQQLFYGGALLTAVSVSQLIRRRRAGTR